MGQVRRSNKKVCRVIQGYTYVQQKTGYLVKCRMLYNMGQITGGKDRIQQDGKHCTGILQDTLGKDRRTKKCMRCGK
jgi:hypothetical protein